jgi:hypothetical protein
MKTTRYNLVALTVALCGITLSAVAQNDIVTNRLSFSARLGFNISARFKGITASPVGIPATPRSTPSQPGRPDGDPYNYDDGFVLTDVSDNYGGQTWYWGYDNASQISGNTILLSRTTTAAAGSSKSIEDDPSLGCELTYNRLLGVKGDARYGVEAAVNYLNLSLHANDTFIRGSATRVTDAYPFTAGTTPPNTTFPGGDVPYQGSFEGPGFVIGDTPVGRPITTVVPGPAVTDKRQFDGDLWGFRLGPYLEVPLGGPLDLSISGGLAVGLLDADASWSQTTGRSTLAGSGSDFDVLWGGYVSAAMTWYLSERWSLVGGAQYQTLSDYEHSFGGRKVEVDLSNTWFVTLGLSYKF